MCDKFVELPEEVLKKVNSNDIEAYIQKLHEKREVLLPEHKRLKIVRRLVKNREYAQNSRNRQRQYTISLTDKCIALENEIRMCHMHIINLEYENAILKL